MEDCDHRLIRRSQRCPWRSQIKVLLSTKTSDHGPYSNKINVDGRAKGTLKSGGKLETGSIGAFIEGISKGDLFFVVSRQQPNLVAGEMGEKL